VTEFRSERPAILKPPRILAVDDRVENLIALEALLEEIPCQLIKFNSGFEILNYLQQDTDVALILMDAQMPEMDGFQTSAEIRKLPGAQKIPVIFITALDDNQKYIHRAYQAGAVDFIFKPIDSDILLSKISVFLELYNSKILLAQQEKQFLESRLRIVTNTVPALISYIDSDSRYQFVNAQYAQWFGCTIESIIGKTVSEVLGEAQYLQRKPYLERALRGENVSFETFLMNPLGQMREVTISYNPEIDLNHKVRGVVVHVTDITDQKEIQDRIVASENMFKQVFNESFSFMVIFKGPEFRIERANEQCFKLLGRSEILNRPFSQALPEMEEQGFGSLLQKVYNTKTAFFGNEVPLSRRNQSGLNQELFLDFVYQPLINSRGEIYGILMQGNDVTEKVLSRRAIERSKNAIEVERKNFRNLFKQTPEMVCILSGPEHVFEFVNEAHIKVLGFDATGKSVRAAQPESVEVHGILDQVYQTGQTAELFEIPVTVGKRRRYFNLTYAAKTDVDGHIDGVMILGTEVTTEVLNRNVLKESQERYKLLFDNSPLPKWIFDIESLRFMDVNQVAIQHYGYSREEFQQMRLTDILCEQTDSSIADPVQDPPEKDQNELFRHIRHRRRDGSIIHVEVSTHDLILGDRLCRLAAVIDVTEKIQIEEKQKELFRNLEIAKDEAIRANELKSAFLANMSHEIRTPLGAMIGFADLLRDPTISDDERNTFIDIMTRNGHQLSHLIDDILDLSKVESGHLTVEKIETDLYQVAGEVVSLLSVKAKEKGLSLQLQMDSSVPSSFVTDPLRLRQILLNIIGNAIKFTSSGEVTVTAHSPRKDEICIEVTDTGVGIPEKDITKLFQVFHQADESVTRKYGGTGLGLALSKALAQALGGDVILKQSHVLKGSTFQVFIRSAAVAQAPQFPVSTNDGITLTDLEGLQNVKILIVEDAPDNQALIRKVLSNAGIVLEFASNGMEGVEKALSNQYDLILMDIQMPIMDGYTATQKLRDSGFRKPIIALTAHAMNEARIKCLNVGCTDYLTKPLEAARLLATVQRYSLPLTPVQKPPIQ
jgi:PAS domain S-box-containing protein